MLPSASLYWAALADMDVCGSYTTSMDCNIAPQFERRLSHNVPNDTWQSGLQRHPFHSLLWYNHRVKES